jgi:hypothetical protein
LKRGRLLQRFLAVSGLTHNLQILVDREESSQTLPKKRLIIRYQYSYGHMHALWIANGRKWEIPSP